MNNDVFSNAVELVMVSGHHNPQPWASTHHLCILYIERVDTKTKTSSSQLWWCRLYDVSVPPRSRFSSSMEIIWYLKICDNIISQNCMQQYRERRELLLHIPLLVFDERRDKEWQYWCVNDHDSSKEWRKIGDHTFVVGWNWSYSQWCLRLRTSTMIYHDQYPVLWPPVLSYLTVDVVSVGLWPLLGENRNATTAVPAPAPLIHPYRSYSDGRTPTTLCDVSLTTSSCPSGDSLEMWLNMNPRPLFEVSIVSSDTIPSRQYITWIVRQTVMMRMMGERSRCPINLQIRFLSSELLLLITTTNGVLC
jgi:hypothetical protein